MKKKILLLISMIAVLTCLFAISISAAELKDGIYYSFSGTGEDAVATVTADNLNCTLTEVNIPETVEHGGVTYRVTTIAAHAFSGSSWSGNKTLQEITIPASVTSIGDHTFRNCTALQTVVIKAKNSNGISLSNANFYGCTALTSVDMSESDVSVIGQYCFHGCSNLATLLVSPELKTFGSVSLRYCTSLTTLDVSKTKLTDIKGIWGPPLTQLVLPPTVTTIRGNGIQDTQLTTLVLPHGITLLEQNCIANNYSLYLMVFPVVSEDASIHSNLFNGATPEVVIYPGNNEDASFTKLTGTGGPFASYTVLPFSEYDPTKTYSGKNFFYGADTCDVCNGLVDKSEENKCCGICSNCGAKDIFDNPEHTTEWTVIGAYLTGYTATNTCIYCENDINSEIIDPLFTSKGYSCTVFDGVISIVQGFDINREAIARYEELADKQVSYGVVATSVNKVADGNIDVVNKVDGVTAIDFTAADKAEFTRFEIKVADIADANQNTGLYACAYVIEDGAVSFISENACTAQAVAKTAATILQENPV